MEFSCFLSSQVDDNKKLGEWVGLCKIDKEGKPRKVVRCSCVVVKVSDLFPVFVLLVHGLLFCDSIPCFLFLFVGLGNENNGSTRDAHQVFQITARRWSGQ